MRSPEENKGLFLVCMSALQGQYEHDMEVATKLSSIFGDAEIPVYNNGAVFNALVKLLSCMFDDPNTAQIRINNFMYEENFGKHTKNTASSIWDELWAQDWDEFLKGKIDGQANHSTV